MILLPNFTCKHSPGSSYIAEREIVNIWGELIGFGTDSMVILIFVAQNDIVAHWWEKGYRCQAINGVLTWHIIGMKGC